LANLKIIFSEFVVTWWNKLVWNWDELAFDFLVKSVLSCGHLLVINGWQLESGEKASPLLNHVLRSFASVLQSHCSRKHQFRPVFVS